MANVIRNMPGDGLKGGGSKPGAFDREVAVPSIPAKPGMIKGAPAAGARITESGYAATKGQTA